MNSSVSIALIVCGALLVSMPFWVNVAAVHVAASVMMSDSGRAHLSAELSKMEPMRWAAFFAGLMMVVIGTVGAFKPKSPC